eukprot:m.180000 g.180000  ORF g.180000 m.180000 type:complete len:90 (+) comp14941_c0_seq5:1287-1556(+)
MKRITKRIAVTEAPAMVPTSTSTETTDIHYNVQESCTHWGCTFTCFGTEHDVAAGYAVVKVTLGLTKRVEAGIHPPPWNVAIVPGVYLH